MRFNQARHWKTRHRPLPATLQFESPTFDQQELINRLRHLPFQAVARVLGLKGGGDPGAAGDATGGLARPLLLWSSGPAEPQRSPGQNEYL